MDVIIKVSKKDNKLEEKNIKDILQTFDAIKHVEVHPHIGKVKIGYNQEQVTLEQICDAMEAQGYNIDR